MGISSTKRRGSGTVLSSSTVGWKIFYSGDDANHVTMSSQADVDLLVSPSIAERVVDWVPLGGSSSSSHLLPSINKYIKKKNI